MKSLPLDNLTIASPCPADWDAMKGDDRKRFCGQCQLHVYNLSGMSQKEAENLVTQSEGRLCVRFFQRKDGTVITQDCPVGLAAVARHYRHIKAAVISMAIGLMGFLGYQRVSKTHCSTPPPSETLGGIRATMGDVAVKGKISR